LGFLRKAGIPGLLVSGGANFATLMYMLPSKPTGEDIAGLYAAHPELYRGVCITILAWNVMFCLVAYMLEQSVQIRLMDESEHKNLFLAKMSHEMRFDNALNSTVLMCESMCGIDAI
jgi:hypothetical protein